MRRSLPAIVLLFFALAAFQSTLGQTESDFEEEMVWLRGDIRISDLVVYADVKKVEFADRSDDKTDCENRRENSLQPNSIHDRRHRTQPFGKAAKDRR